MDHYTSIAQAQRRLNCTDEELMRRALQESRASSGQDLAAVFSLHSESIRKIYQEVIGLANSSASQSSKKQGGVFSLLHGWIYNYPPQTQGLKLVKVGKIILAVGAIFFRRDVFTVAVTGYTALTISSRVLKINPTYFSSNKLNPVFFDVFLVAVEIVTIQSCYHAYHYIREAPPSSNVAAAAIMIGFVGLNYIYIGTDLLTNLNHKKSDPVVNNIDWKKVAKQITKKRGELIEIMTSATDLTKEELFELWVAKKKEKIEGLKEVGEGPISQEPLFFPVILNSNHFHRFRLESILQYVSSRGNKKLLCPTCRDEFIKRGITLDINACKIVETELIKILIPSES